MRKYSTYTCAEDGQTFTNAPAYANHIWSKHKRAKTEQPPNDQGKPRLIPDQTNQVVFHITPQEWVEWNAQLLETIRHQKEMIIVWQEKVANAAMTIKSLEVGNRQLSDALAKYQVAKIENEQALAYQDYAKGR